jgi:hypothetical protein
MYLYAYSGTKLASITEPGQSNSYLFNNFDAQGRVVLQQLGTAAQIISLNYSQFPKVIVADRVGNTIEEVVDPTSHQVMSRTIVGSGPNPPRYTTTYTYNTDFLMTQRTWPSGAIESWTYDTTAAPLRRANVLEYRHRQSSLDTVGRWATFTYNLAFNAIATITAPRVNADASIQSNPAYKLRMTYDTAGNMTRTDFPRVIDAGGISHDAYVAWQFDSRGRPTLSTDARGIQTQFTYTGAAPLPTTEVKDPTGIAATISRHRTRKGTSRTSLRPAAAARCGRRLVRSRRARTAARST